MYKHILLFIFLGLIKMQIAISQTPVPPPDPYRVNVQVSITPNGGLQTVSYTWNMLPSYTSTVLLLYRSAGTTQPWINSAPGNADPRSWTIPAGNYDYAIQIFYNNGAPTQIVLANSNTYLTNSRYIRTWEAKVPEQSGTNLVNRPVSEVAQSTSYFDGLGRQIQTVKKQASPTNRDLVTTNLYDAMGKESYKYMAFSSNIVDAADVPNDGNFKGNPFQQQAAFYQDNVNGPIRNQNEHFFYSQIEYEPSPLGRVTKTFAPGDSWMGSRGTGNEKPIQQQYLVNTVNDDVRIWNLSSATGGPTTVSANVTTVNKLIVTVVNNGNGTQTATYTWSTNNGAPQPLPGVNTVLFMSRPLGSTGSWNICNVSGNSSWGSTCTLSAGSYEYAIQLYYTTGAGPVVTNGNSVTLTGTGSTTTVLAYNNTTFTSSSSYPAGKLNKKITIDEQNRQVVEFTDQDDKVILKKVQVGNTVTDGHAGWLCTYYIYDDFGLLRGVLPPKATEAFLNGTPVSSFLDELCFRYEYDAKHRMIIKKIPGAGEVWMVYDARDRLIMVQDANLRILGKWIVNTYDLLNRQVKSGLLLDPSDFPTQRSNAYNLIDYPVISGSNYELLTQTYFDSYDWVASTGTTLDASLNTANTSSSTYFEINYDAAPLYAQAITPSYQTRGLVTGSVVKVLNINIPKYLYSVNFYDKNKHLIQTESINSAGYKDITTNQYDFNGKVIRSLLNHQNLYKTSPLSSQIHTVLSKMTYDNAGRLLSIKKNVNSVIPGFTITPATDKIILQNTYDELGQLKTKKLGTNPGTSNELENLAYDYNIRGWLLGINRDFITGTSAFTNHFGIEVAYDKITAAAAGTNYSAAQYTGNVAGTLWKSIGDGVNRQYDFSYDNANRLLKAEFKQKNFNGNWDNTTVNYGVKMGDGSNYASAYDANGNIKRMQQWGLKINHSEQIDDIVYNYASNDITNKLAKVTENAPGSTPPSGAGSLGDFKDGTNGTTDDYSYDLNGNIKLDNNKGISSVEYNYINQPQRIITAKGSVTYTYDATGVKLSKQTVETNTAGTTITTTTDYIGEFVYESKNYSPAIPATPNYENVLQSVSHEEGKIRLSPDPKLPTDYAFDYFIKDNLGNVRMVLTDDQQRISKYPAATVEGTYSPTGTTQANSMVNYEKQFYNIDNTKIIPETSIPSWNPETVANTKLYYNHNGNPPSNLSYPPGCIPVQTDQSNNLYKVNASSNRTGLEFMIKVMQGDKIDILGKSYFLNTGDLTNNNTPLDLVALMTNLLTSPANAAASKGLSSSDLTSINSGVVPSNFFRGTNGEVTTVPKAYINYIFFDDQFRYAGGNFSRVGSSGTVKDHWYTDPVQLQGITVPKNGYLFVYVSNESNVDVYFDNLQVIHKPGPLMEENHYYPFGLLMKGISSKALDGINNRYKFGGKEFQSNEFSDESGLEMYDFSARNFDPQIGRWWSNDPMADKAPELSPYRYAFNNPVRFFDPSGQYETDGHFWTVYLMTTLMGRKDAYNIAYYTEAPDNIMASNGDRISSVGFMGLPTSSSVQQSTHALIGGPSARARTIAQNMLNIASTDEEIGTAIHYFGDSYSHSVMGNESQMYPTGRGHLFDWHDPDYISKRPDLYLEYVKSLAIQLGGKFGAAPIDMFTFNYVAKSGGTTEQNSAVFETEVRIREGGKTFSVKGDQVGTITNYLNERNGNYLNKAVFAHVVYTDVDVYTKNKKGEWEKTTEKRTYVTFIQ